jgi:hypothetical protein
MQLVLLVLAVAARLAAQQPAPIRPPATPLIAHDPYFSVWSASNHINDQATRHWTGAEQPVTGLVRIDSQTYRFLGGVPRWADQLPRMNQVAFQLTPTRTMYSLEAGGVRLDLTFLTPALPHDLEVLARPVTYLAWSARATDGRSHSVKVYVDSSSYIALNRPEQRPQWSRMRIGDFDALRVGSAEQNVLGKSGDDLRIDWGFFYLAVPPQSGKIETRAVSVRTRAQFAATLDLPDTDLLEPPIQITRDDLLLAATIDRGSVGAEPVNGYFLLAYDDLFSIEYFNRRLRPYWRRNGMGVDGLLKAAIRDYTEVEKRSKQFDDELSKDLVAAGGPKYAALSILAYRQAIAAHKLAADADGTPLFFSKENFSNGCIATVDVTYPSAPLFLLLNPTLLKGMLKPVLDYSRMPRWRFPYAPHDLGQYPLANGQVYGGGELTEDRQMPVEESGNMLILLAALAEADGNVEFSRPYAPILSKWAAYLREKGLDPENQLSTDDFAGHMAHNTNLSLKAILALASYARLAERFGQRQEASSYAATAKDMAAKWVKMADDGDHYRLAFDQKGTWSQKYNLVWDKLLKLGLFPPDVARKEIAYYKTKQNAFGLPLDNRSEYTKLDWIIWTATLADNAADFAAIADPAYKFANETPTRVPLSDWYWTNDGKQRGFQARSVVGGIFIKMLEDASRWKRWVDRAPAN